jgi:hypothetical protein
MMSTNKAGTNFNGPYGSIHAVPTPDEIDARIADTIATHAAHEARRTEVWNATWFAVAVDPHGERRSSGEGLTSTEACVDAWIMIWLTNDFNEDFSDDFRDVPRVVPEGWRFEVYPPGQLFGDKAG